MQIPLAQRLLLVAAGSALLLGGALAPGRTLAQAPAPAGQQTPAPAAVTPPAPAANPAAEPGSAPAASAVPPQAEGVPPLVQPVPRWNVCVPTRYEGPQTTLYIDRDYYTQETVPALVGLEFCRGRRHGKSSWMLAVSKPATLYTLANASYRLEDAGWRRLEASVRVDAAGVGFDALYALDVAPGRYLVHQSHAPTSLPVFWSSQAVRVLAPSSGRSGSRR
jgi:hypothetical protein